MPYIEQEDRRYIDQHADAIAPAISTEGQLNYAISRIIHKVVAYQGKSYSTYNAILGVLDAVPREFYRTEVAPYEEEKRKLNGPVA